ncbi:hypothetical protein AGMMS49543_20720 [Betaproteobacteria bacterium]|nr:hypothetical protein AGMMS49543_20720 [Betaproteobacteria bacterium]
MALTQVTHDSTLDGLGTVAYPLLVSAQGHAELEEQPQRPVFYTTLSVTEGMFSCQTSDLQPINPDASAYQIHGWVTSQDGHWGTIRKVDGLIVEIEFWLRPTMYGSGNSRYFWSDIKGELYECPALWSILGNRNNMTHGTNYVDNINAIIAKLGV